jgi:WD40 repeat protein
MTDNRTLVMSHFDAMILWDVQTGREVKRFAKPADPGRGYGPELGGVSPDGRTLLTNLGVLQRWDLATGQALFAVPPDDGLGGPIERLAFTPDGKTLFAASWNLRSAQWNVVTGKQTTLVGKRFGHQLVTTPDGLRSVGAENFKTPHEVTVYDPIAGKEVQTIRWADPKEVGINGLRAYTLTADGRTLLVAHADEPGHRRDLAVTVCDVRSGRRLARFRVPGSPSLILPPFSPCGRWALLNSRVYHTTSGKELFGPVGEPGERLQPTEAWTEKGPVWFSPDGRLLAGRLEPTTGGGLPSMATLAVWELASGKMLARFPKCGLVAQVAFSLDGRTVALVDAQGVHLHDLLSGRRLPDYQASDVTCDLTDRGCTTQTAVFSPEGRTLATGHRDGTILLWAVPRRERPKAALAEVWTDLGADSPARALAAVDWLVHDQPRGWRCWPPGFVRHAGRTIPRPPPSSPTSTARPSPRANGRRGSSLPWEQRPNRRSAERWPGCPRWRQGGGSRRS